MEKLEEDKIAVIRVYQDKLKEENSYDEFLKASLRLDNNIQWITKWELEYVQHLEQKLHTHVLMTIIHEEKENPHDLFTSLVQPSCVGLHKLIETILYNNLDEKLKILTISTDERIELLAALKDWIAWKNVMIDSLKEIVERMNGEVEAATSDTKKKHPLENCRKFLSGCTNTDGVHTFKKENFTTCEQYAKEHGLKGLQGSLKSLIGKNR